jgi:hypothetical protein
MVKKKERTLRMVFPFNGDNVGHIDELFKGSLWKLGLELGRKALQDKP